MNSKSSYRSLVSIPNFFVGFMVAVSLLLSCSESDRPRVRPASENQTPANPNEGVSSTDIGGSDINSDSNDTDSTPDADADSTPDADSDSDSDGDGDADADSDADSDADIDINDKDDTDNDTNIEVDSNSDTGADGDGDTDSDTDADGDSDTDADGDSDTDADGDSDTDADGDSDTDADGDSDMDADGDSDTDADGESDTDADAAVDDCPGCIRTEEIGMGTDTPWDLEAADSGFVSVDEEGALVIDREKGGGQNLIWIVNTQEESVSKIDTDTRAELARYRIGGLDPSRTSVAPNGDAYVGCRGAGQLDKAGVTKIAASINDCVDRNSDGVITTSAGPGDIVAPDYDSWADDECVIWHTHLTDFIRGVAVQAIPERFEIVDVADGPPQITKIPGEYFVWAGGNSTDPRIFKLDGETGDVLIDVPSPIMTYGFALDGRDRLRDVDGGPFLWISGDNEHDNMAHVDTSKCTDNQNCNVAPCRVADCSQTRCSSECDNAIMAHYTLNPPDTYGITVDCKQRVWIAGLSEGMKRYDPFLPETERFRMTSSNSAGANGIAADAKGFIWGAHGGDLIKQDAEDFSQAGSALVKVQGAKGVAVDRTGNVWAIPQENAVDVVEPGDDLTTNTVITDAIVTAEENPLVGPYTYSDMSGQQLMLASNDPGYYRQLFTCEGSQRTWYDLEWDVALPAGTHVVFSIRNAETLDVLAQSDWIPFAGVTDATQQGSRDLGALINQIGGKYLELEITMYMDNPVFDGKGCVPSNADSPRIKKFSITSECVNIVIV